MNFLKRLIFLLIATVVTVVALLAGADNSANVTLKFLDYETWSWPISGWVLSAFVIGVLFGTILNFLANTRLRMDARAARKTAEGRTKELDQIRAEVVRSDDG